MACCLLAAFLLAQCAETLRRWGVLFGLRPVEEGMTSDTAYQRIREFAVRPNVRRFVVMAVAAELSLVLVWLSIDHREHIIRIVNYAVAELNGQPYIRNQMCVADRQTVAQLDFVKAFK